jgi:hypothetical protein
MFYFVLFVTFFLSSGRKTKIRSNCKLGFDSRGHSRGQHENERGRVRVPPHTNR